MAILAIKNSINKSVASREWGIPYSTLLDRFKGTETHSKAAESQQKLSKSQEEHLANWVLTQEALGCPLTYAQVREFAKRVLAIKGDNKTLGKH